MSVNSPFWVKKTIELNHTSVLCLWKWKVNLPHSFSLYLPSLLVRKFKNMKQVTYTALFKKFLFNWYAKGKSVQRTTCYYCEYKYICVHMRNATKTSREGVSSGITKHFKLLAICVVQKLRNISGVTKLYLKICCLRI